MISTVTAKDPRECEGEEAPHFQRLNQWIDDVACIYFRGVKISFSRHSPNWRVVQLFYLPSQKTTGQKI
jgi:hypothetical protein